MALILSISKKRFLINLIFKLTVLASLFASCSHEKKVIVEASKTDFVSVTKKLAMGPELTSSVFIDRSTEYGLSGVKAVNLYAVDVDHDGYTDLVTLEDYFSPPQFYFFNPTLKKFILGTNPFEGIVRASFLNFVDLNHDGIYDVIVGILNQKTEMTQYPSRIFKGSIENNKLHYSEEASLPTPALPTASLVALDFDLDGELDLYLANWFSLNKLTGARAVPDLLLKGNRFQFTDSSSKLTGEYIYNKSDKVYPNATPTFGASICDVDQNGFPDIMTSNSNGYYNKLWLNLEGLTFENFGNQSGYSADIEGTEATLGGGNSFFSLCGDYNNDGIIDIVEGNLSKETDPETIDKSFVLTGSKKSFPPQFIRTEILLDREEDRLFVGDRRGVWIDYNLDGLNDLIIDNSGFPPHSRLSFFEQIADHSFEDRSKLYGINILNPAGTVTIDVNRDGVMDFISGQSSIRTGATDNRLYLFENQSPRKSNGSVRFHLQAKKSNYHGISSSVWLSTNRHTYFFNNEYNGGSIPSQNEEGAYFAYNLETPQSVNVKWSYGQKDRLGRLSPMMKKYDLSKLHLKGHHTELNLCEDGRILLRQNDCF
jgi:hypothetical protein